MLSCEDPAPLGCWQTLESGDPSAGILHPSERGRACFLHVLLSLIHPELCVTLMLWRREGESGLVRLKAGSGLLVSARIGHWPLGLLALLMGCTHSAVVRTNSRASSCLIPLRSDADRSSCGFPGPWSSPKVTAERAGGLKGALS